MKQNLRIGVCEVNTSGTSEHPQAKIKAQATGEHPQATSDRRDYSFFLTLPIFQDSIVEIWITIL